MGQQKKYILVFGRVDRRSVAITTKRLMTPREARMGAKQPRQTLCRRPAYNLFGYLARPTVSATLAPRVPIGAPPAVVLSCLV